jgi:transcriptional regulator with XRE-family HTH domain
MLLYGVVRVNTKRYCSSMEQTGPLTPTAVVAARMHALRVKRGWSAAELARRMRAAGIPWERLVVTKLETGRRASVSVAEMFALAAVLNCPPVMLMTADERDEADYQPGRVNLNYQVTPTVTSDMGSVRAWIRGVGSLLDDDDPREFYAELPRGEYFHPGHMTSDGEAWVGPVQGRWPPQRPEAEHEEAGTDG